MGVAKASETWKRVGKSMYGLRSKVSVVREALVACLCDFKLTWDCLLNLKALTEKNTSYIDVSTILQKKVRSLE